MIGGTIISNGNELNFSRYLYFQISAITTTTVTYDSTTVALNAGQTVELNFFTTITPNPNINVLGIVRLTPYVENNRTSPISFRSGLAPVDSCCRFVNETIVSNPSNPTFFILSEDLDILTDELGNRLIFV